MSSSSESTTLAEGVINGDELSVQLIRPADRPLPVRERSAQRVIVGISWPPSTDDCLARNGFPRPRPCSARLFRRGQHHIGCDQSEQEALNQPS